MSVIEPVLLYFCVFVPSSSCVFGGQYFEILALYIFLKIYKNSKIFF